MDTNMENSFQAESRQQGYVLLGAFSNMDAIFLSNCHQEAVDIATMTQNVAAYFDVTSHTQHDMTLTLLQEESMEPSSMARDPADLQRSLNCTSMTLRDMSLTLLKDSQMQATNMVQNCCDHEDTPNSASGIPQEASETTIMNNCSIHGSDEVTSPETISSHRDGRSVRRAAGYEEDNDSDNNRSFFGASDAIPGDDSQSSDEDTLPDDYEAPSNSDIVYKPYIDVNNSAAVGRFLETRVVSEDSSCTEETAGNQKDSLAHSEGSSRDEPEDTIKTARSVDVEVFRSTGFLESTPCSGLECTTRKRTLAVSNVLSPIKYQGPVTKYRDASGRRHLEQACRQQVNDKENINIIKNYSAVTAAPLQRLNRRHVPVEDNETFFDGQLSARDCQDSVVQGDRRFFRAHRLKKTYVQQYLSSTEYRRTCERSKKYFVKKSCA